MNSAIFLSLISCLLFCSVQAIIQQNGFVIDTPRSDSVIGSAQSVPVFGRALGSTSNSDFFTFCAVIDANLQVVGDCSTPTPGKFSVSQLQNGVITANMPKKSSSTLTLIFATVSANSKTCFGQTCVINVIKSSGFNIVVYADSGAISPTLSTSDLDPAQFGMIVNVPNSITKDTAIDVKVDTRFNEATLITNCNVIEENGNINKDCIVPDGSTTEIKIASFRSGSVKVGVDQTMIGKKFKVVLDVSSPGCRVDNDCFSNTVSSSVFSVLREKINDGAPPVENVQSPAPIVLSPSPVVVSPSPVSPSPSAVLPSNISSSSTTDVKTETKTTTITSVVSTTTTTPGQNEQQPSKIPDVPGRNDGKPGKKTFAAQPTSTTTTTTRTPIGGLVLGNSSGKLDISRIGLVVSIASSIVVYIF